VTGLVLGVAVVAALGTAAAVLRPSAPSARTLYAYVTYYGWFDNTPPGCATAYSGCAGGNGTYAHPITLATDKAEIPVGTIVYYPTVEKYFVMGDDCQECDADWSGKGPDGGPGYAHVDLWIGGHGGRAIASLDCEDALTQSTASGAPLQTPLIVDAPSGMPVSTEQLFDARTGHCFGGATTTVSFGRYRNAGTGLCLKDAGDGTTSGLDAATSPCSSAASEDLAYQGAFLSDRSLCLEVDGSRPGARLVFSTCDGQASQQFEIDPDGTIAWVQVLECVSDAAGAVELATCTSADDERWAYVAERAPS